MKKLILIGSLLFTLTAGAQQRADTAVVIKTTNNQLYQVATLLQVAAQQLQDSNMPTNQLKEFNKLSQQILTAWFEQKKLQDEELKKKKQ